jgi:pyruvate formate lyase activating enzyme
MTEALLYRKLKAQQVQCQLCQHRCVIAANRRGLCGVRENRSGKLETLVYGRVIARHVDPIEKKPIFHMLPGSRAYSIATAGCNFTCRFCQNADIAQLPADRDGMIAGVETTPEEVVAEALKAGCRSLAYTYTEPTVFFEFALDCARLAAAQGLRNIFVTNGYMTPEAIEMIRPYLDTANVDLKAFSDSFYRDTCGARLKPVLDTLKAMVAAGILVEVTTLLIPGLNDSPDELQNMAGFLARDLGSATPWHISRFHPSYRMTDREPTPLVSLEQARDIGLAAGLRYVYIGNVPGSTSENTYCPACGNIVIIRFHYNTRVNLIDTNRCAYCHAIIDGIF